MNKITHLLKNGIDEIKSDSFYIFSIIFGIFLFIPSIYFDFFIFDDDDNIRKNLLMTNFTISHFLYPWTVTKIPLSFNLWQTISLLFGNENALSFKIFSIIIHLLNASLIYSLAKKTFTNNKILAQIALFLFICHPINVQSVVWVSSQRELLSTFFILIATNLYSTKESLGLKRLILMVFFWFISLLFKPITITAPIIFCIFYYFRRKNNELASKDSKYLPVVFIIGLLLFLVGVFSYIGEIFKPEALIGYTAQSSLTSMVVSLSTYLFNYFLPISLEFNYTVTLQTVQRIISEPQGIFKLLILALPFFLIKLSKQKARAILSLLVFFFLIILNSGLIPFTHQNISIVTDRYMYLPAIGLIFLICFFLEDRDIKKTVFITFAIAISFLTVKEVSLWKNNSTRLYSNNMTNEIKKTSYIQALIRDRKYEKALTYMEKEMDPLSDRSIAIKISLSNAIPKYEISPIVFHHIKETYRSAPKNFIPYFANLAYKKKDYKLARTLAIYASSLRLKHLLQFKKADLNIQEDIESDKSFINSLITVYDKDKEDFEKVSPILLPYVNNKDYFYKILRDRVERNTKVDD
jgi:hypothetical protein